ncbi:MAG TPA: hypothetical protein VN154_02100 [Rhizomicrobium sp.]|nr:hypothetical protein [Rhizomicrobium sp.]
MRFVVRATEFQALFFSSQNAGRLRTWVRRFGQTSKTIAQINIVRRELRDTAVTANIVPLGGGRKMTVNAHHFHRGIGFSVKEVATGRWQWAIYPPKSVKGLVRKSGEIQGERTNAVAAAKIEIEAQDLGATAHS